MSTAFNEAEPRVGDALLIVDLQNDFLPGGALPVPDGDKVVPVLNHWIERFSAAGLPVMVTRDWHPEKHCSFKPQGGVWPPHCVAGTLGAAFPSSLLLPQTAWVVNKGTQRESDAYSGFSGTDLHWRLHDKAIRRLFIGGLATEYCIAATVNSALSLNYSVYLLLDAVRPIKADDGHRAIAGMQAHGALLLEG